MSTLIARLQTSVAEYPIIIEHPSLLMNEAADRIKELEQKLKDIAELPDKWHKPTELSDNDYDKGQNYCADELQALMKEK